MVGKIQKKTWGLKGKLTKAFGDGNLVEQLLYCVDSLFYAMRLVVSPEGPVAAFKNNSEESIQYFY